ncbi:unnamed protein product [Taenia asiatica]|uniref:PHR domain-containing protein n=1 Tax=Taenia asiatica TaxID=60517 RepID=A0A0R3VYV3_TAEAS|nr:unnamed protein product [Taenia asiatica]
MRECSPQPAHLVGIQMTSLSGRQQVYLSQGGVVVYNTFPPPSTMQTIGMCNGHLGGEPSDNRVHLSDGESAAAVELLTLDANDLIDVDGASSSRVGGDSMNGAASAITSSFRQSDEEHLTFSRFKCENRCQVTVLLPNIQLVYQLGKAK